MLERPSQEAAAVLSEARALAQRHAHEVVGSEHLLLALASNAEARTWVAAHFPPPQSAQGHPKEGEDEAPDELGGLGAEFWEACSSAVLARAPFQPNPQRHPTNKPNPSSELRAVLVLAAGGPWAEEDWGNAETGTHLLLAALVVEGTSSGAQVLFECSRSRLNAQAVLAALGVAEHKDRRHKLPDSARLIRVNHQNAARRALRAYLPVTPEISQLPRAPLKQTNWILPHHLMIGGTPWDDAQMRALVVDGDVHTIVCLMGELGGRFEEAYPLSTLKYTGRCVDVVHFPVRDFGVVGVEEVAAVVVELRRRVWQGECVVVHCRGGHGRTGMVVVPLVATLLNLDFDTARQLVSECHDANRRLCGKWGCDIPEMDEQEEVARLVVDRLSEQIR